MSEQTPRELLALADSHRRVAEGAESLRRGFRLGGQEAVKKGLFGLRRSSTDEFRELTSSESLALYEAAGIVQRRELERAKECEAQVTMRADA